jgi:ornithine carbamoyltransferase
MFDGIEFRGFSQQVVEDLAKFSGVPVWNGLTDEWHPTQMIADFMTIKENFGTLENITLVYVGDGRNNMANSLLVTGAILGVNVRICTPKELFPAQEVTDYANKFAKESGSQLMVTDDIQRRQRCRRLVYRCLGVNGGRRPVRRAGEAVERLPDQPRNGDGHRKTRRWLDRAALLASVP